MVNRSASGEVIPKVRALGDCAVKQSSHPNRSSSKTCPGGLSQAMLHPMTPGGRAGTPRRRRLEQPWFSALPMVKRSLLPGATALVAFGANGPGADPVNTATHDKIPIESKPRRVFSNSEGNWLSDADQREYLKAKLALAEKDGTKSNQEIEGLKKAIAEPSERIAKGPSDSEMFALTLENSLAIQRGEAKRHFEQSQRPWSFELNARIDAPCSPTPKAQWFCQADFNLTPEHAASNLGAVKLGDLLPYAKKEVANAPVAHQNRDMYLQDLILTATNQEMDFSGDWPRHFERNSMKWDKGHFPGDVTNLKQTL